MDSMDENGYFSSAGVPLRAQVNMSLSKRASSTGCRQGARAPPSAFQQAQAGDTVQQMAARNSDSNWQDTAIANRIENPQCWSGSLVAMRRRRHHRHRNQRWLWRWDIWRGVVRRVRGATLGISGGASVDLTGGGSIGIGGVAGVGAGAGGRLTAGAGVGATAGFRPRPVWRVSGLATGAGQRFGGRESSAGAELR
jgi:hypothetical protein